eukprot:TRINITY_DN4891_c0_g1_i1.p1 TRINITY_DN4891_c0_g1~~TRINITY_DN4891_c0_g1_i1.p1  ORF type:complete len:315 (+),score=81.78 TRINITY_DN4891_c0_g1_i1:49-993(+)
MISSLKNMAGVSPVSGERLMNVSWAVDPPEATTAFTAGLLAALVVSYWVCLREERRFGAERREVPAHYRGTAPYWAWEINAKFTPLWTCVLMAAVLADSAAALRKEPGAVLLLLDGGGRLVGKTGPLTLALPDPNEVAAVLRYERGCVDYGVLGAVTGIMLKDFAWFARHPDLAIAAHHVFVMFIAVAVAFRTPLCLRSCTLTTLLMEMGSAAYCWFVVLREPGHAPFAFMAFTNVVWVAAVAFWYSSNKGLLPDWILWGCVGASANIFLGRMGAMWAELVHGYMRERPRSFRLEKKLFRRGGRRSLPVPWRPE